MFPARLSLYFPIERYPMKTTKTTTEHNYGLDAEDVKALAAEYAASKKIPNPNNKGCYRFIIAALTNLGMNKPHPLAEVYERFQKEAGSEWFKAWKSKEKRNAEKGKDANGRFLQNIQVLQRVKDYGLRLLQVGTKVMKTKGCVIDLTREAKGGLLVTLNTDSPKPLKPARDNKAPKGAAVAALAKK